MTQLDENFRLILVRPKVPLVTIRDYLNKHMRRSTISCWLAIPPGLLTVFASGHPTVQYPA
jgi:hypothetical protein